MRIRQSILGLAAATLIAVPASAQTVSSIHFGGGLFVPKGLDSRVDGDVLVRNYDGRPVPSLPMFSDALVFDIKDFRSGNVFAEYTAGISAFGRTVPTVYLDLIDERNREIDQELKLRVVPLTAVVRFLPFGRAGDVQPYVGAGVAALNFRYSETGRFVDTDTLDIFEDRFTTSGTAPGLVVLGGLRLPLGGDVYGMSLEGRYLKGAGDTGGLDQGFLDEKIDLGGFLFNVGFQVRF
jgi:opacity protein-like surface antigen